LVAGDTFRAAAIEQLEIWGQRVDCPVVKHQSGSDPSAVIFDGLSAARARGMDVVIVDTAGRMHTKFNLMEELKKMKRVMDKALPGSPHETLLILDATTGQNALSQAKLFHEAIGVTGVVITKLDGTARGGVVVPITEELGIPVKLVGLGEGVEDLENFIAEEFVEGLFGD
jgi:fused signal recognition particle receptor